MKSTLKIALTISCINIAASPLYSMDQPNLAKMMSATHHTKLVKKNANFTNSLRAIHAELTHLQETAQKSQAPKKNSFEDCLQMAQAHLINRNMLATTPNERLSSIAITQIKWIESLKATMRFEETLGLNCTLVLDPKKNGIIRKSDGTVIKRWDTYENYLNGLVELAPLNAGDTILLTMAGNKILATGTWVLKEWSPKQK